MTRHLSLLLLLGSLLACGPTPKPWFVTAVCSCERLDGTKASVELFGFEHCSPEPPPCVVAPYDPVLCPGLNGTGCVTTPRVNCNAVVADYFTC